MTLAVLGAGFGRTGTLSLKIALEMLGLGPCYHMTDVFKHPEHPALWTAAAEGKPDWEKLLAGYQSTVDWPSTYFWRELADAYPNAKVILTLRSTESWIKSATSTIFRAIAAETAADDPPNVTAQRNMAKGLIFDRTFGGIIDDHAHLAKVYESHNEEVKRTISADRLLVYEPREGWEPLCKFLGIPVPPTPYPKVNTTEEFQSRVEKLVKGDH
jgi:Sulfotransferase domain